MHVRRFTQAVAAVLLVGLTMAAPVAAASLGGFGARPAHFDPRLPATRAYFIRTVRSGASFTDQVIVFNQSTRPMRVRVYPADGLTGATSGVVYSNHADTLRGAGRWVTTEVSQLTVAPRSVSRVVFKVRAPADARAGVHLAGIAVEQADPRTSGGRFSVTEVLRTVVGIELRVPGPARPQAQLNAIAPAAPINGASPGFTVSLANAGTGLCKPRLTLTLAGPRGRGTVTRQLDTVLPGDVIAYPFPWPRALSAGRYTEALTAGACGRPTTLHTSETVAAKPARRVATPPPGTVTPAITSRTITSESWWLIVLVGAGGIGSGALLSRRRRPAAES